MHEALPSGPTVLEVTSPNGPPFAVNVVNTPFFIGRGAEGNHLQLDDRRISRQSATLLNEGGRYCLKDRSHRGGLYVNGEPVTNRVLKDGDVISFGFSDSYTIIFRSLAPVARQAPSSETQIESLLTRIGTVSAATSSSTTLGNLNVLLEATMLLHSQLPLEAVLETMVDHAIAVTAADRGLLLQPDSTSALRVCLARGRGRMRLPTETANPSQTALRLALQQQSSVVTQDLSLADADLQVAQSIVAQRLRAVVAIPLYAMPRAGSAGSATPAARGEFLGVLYLDSQRPAAFSKLDRQILDAIGVQAASILDNARLVENERQRQQLEQELNIARQIQQALLPHGFRDFPHLAVSGVNFPCLGVGGDYFDVFPMADGATAFLIADVSGKGLGAALLTTMLQGALSGLSIGTNPALVFNHLNRFLCEHSDVGKYATVFFGVLTPEGNLEFINAGHPSPLVLRGNMVLEPFTQGSFPVGLIPGAEYTASTVRLEPEDTLILFSDGVTEAMDRDNEEYGTERLRDAVSNQHQVPLDKLQKSLMQSVESFTQGTSQGDDITLLLVRYRPATQAASA